MEKNNLDEKLKPSIEIIDFDDNPFKAFEQSPKPVAEPKEKDSQNLFRNIPITQIIDDTEDDGAQATIEVNHSYNNNFIEEKYQNKEISLDKTQKFNDILEAESFEDITKETFEPTFDEMMENSNSISNKIDQVKRIVEQCQRDIEALGYKVELENFDFETMYQVIIKIRK
ncbi:MAG: hypothetical protein IJB71_01850 [Bacilli bacterium]|nr:hypothetical protein [Bacilli bacterium]